LLAGGVERIEGVKELLLRPLLAGEKLDVVEDQHVELAEAIAKERHLILTQGGNQGVDEVLGGKEGNAAARMLLQRLVSDRADQVSLSEPHAAPEEERVEQVRAAFGDGTRRTPGELVGRSDDELV